MSGRVVRAGGYINRSDGRGWVLESRPRPEPERRPGVLTDTEQEADRQTSEKRAELAEMDGEPGPAVNVHTGEETPAGTPLPEVPGERVDCPDCGKPVLVNKDGSLRKHTCVIEAAPPQVTFEQEGEPNGGSDGSGR